VVNTPFAVFLLDIGPQLWQHGAFIREIRYFEKLTGLNSIHMKNGAWQLDQAFVLP
jgi:hypothetical protein